jgi:uncharacterized OB-fold protein
MTQTTTAGWRPIADGLFELDAGGPVLVGSRCTHCETVGFPFQSSCPRCTGGQLERHHLARTGTLWTWTTQGFRPKSPPYTGTEEFTPYAVGYVELGGEIRVEGLLTESRATHLRIGMQMQVTTLELRGPAGEPRLTYAFAPTEAEDQA